jgi:hypothetical protein
LSSRSCYSHGVERLIPDQQYLWGTGLRTGQQKVEMTCFERVEAR